LKDLGKGKDNISVLQKKETFLRSRVGWKAKWKIERFYGDYKSREEAIKAEGKPYSVSEFEGNVMLNEGLNEMWTLVCGGTGTPYNNANARCGVGDSTTAASPTDTGLLGVNQLYKAMDSGYPTFGTNQQAVFRSTFGGTEANWAWEEFCVDNGSAAALDLCRKVESQGTKVSGQTWELTKDIAMS